MRWSIWRRRRATRRVFQRDFRCWVAGFTWMRALDGANPPLGLGGFSGGFAGLVWNHYSVVRDSEEEDAVEFGSNQAGIGVPRGKVVENRLRWP